MKVFIVCENGSNPPSAACSGIEASVRAFRCRDNAQAECDRLNEARQGCYSLAELQVCEDEVEPFEARLAAIQEERMNWVAKTSKTFAAGCRALFEANPALQSFGWEQYTPYYCDGEPCSLTAFYDEPDINGIWGCEVEDGLEANLQAAAKAFLGSFADEVLGELFGDHVRITVHRNGEVETEVYDDHD